MRNDFRADSDLARLAAAGDREAFEVLLDRYVPRVRGFLHRYGWGAADADDLAQETFLVMVRSLGSLRNLESIQSWIFGIAYHLQRVRRHKRRDIIFTDMEAAPEPGDPKVHCSGPAAADDATKIMEQVIERLPERHRAVFHLRHVEEVAIADVARILQITEATVRRLDFEARGMLRRNPAMGRIQYFYSDAQGAAGADHG